MQLGEPTHGQAELTPTSAQPVVRACLHLYDMPGPSGIPLINVAWRLWSGGRLSQQGTTNEQGRLEVDIARTSLTRYELEYLGRRVELRWYDESDDDASDELTARRLGELGYEALARSSCHDSHIHACRTTHRHDGG